MHLDARHIWTVLLMSMTWFACTPEQHDSREEVLVINVDDQDLLTPDDAARDMLVHHHEDMPRDQDSDQHNEHDQNWPADMSLDMHALSASGGSATIEFSPENPFLQFAPDLPLSALRSASLGREFFVAQWTPARTDRPSLDGLGPLSIVSSCVACHPASGQAPSLESNGAVRHGILLRLAHQDTDGAWGADPIYGGQLQTMGLTGVPAEGRVQWTSQPARDGLEEIMYTVSSPGYGAISDRTSWGARRAPVLVGMGLLDAIDDQVIREWEDPDDRDEDGISGRVHDVWDVAGQTTRPGRFGWKALHSSLVQQSAGAFSGDMGLTTTLFPMSTCSPTQSSCISAPSGGEPEVSDTALDSVAQFLSVLGVPARDIQDQAAFEQGRQLFEATGCASCHRPSMVTSPQAHPAILASQTFWPYTDLLLHDMGDELADIPEGEASASEWRTPPLWSLRFIARQSDARLLHDGRARSIEEAILWHGGEGRLSRDAYSALTPQERDALIVFLMSI